MLKITNQCYPTLKELLQQNEDSLGTLKELAKLHKLLDLDKESIKYNKKIIKKRKRYNCERTCTVVYKD